MENTFYKLVIKHFGYLISDFSFVLTDAKGAQGPSEFEGHFEFESSTTFVTVTGLKWMTGVAIGRIKDDKSKYLLDPYAIYEFRQLNEIDKKIVCSHLPQDDRKAREIIFKFRMFSERKKSEDTMKNIEAELIEYSNWLRLYSEPFLRGDFSQWSEIYEYKIARARAEYARSGKSEIVLHIVGKDANGRPIIEKKSTFHDSIEYLERLKWEYPKK